MHVVVLSTKDTFGILVASLLERAALRPHDHGGNCQHAARNGITYRHDRWSVEVPRPSWNFPHSDRHSR